MTDNVSPVATNGSAAEPLPASDAAKSRRSFGATFKEAIPKWRWILGVVALLLAWWGEQLAEDARNQQMSAPPALSWWLFAVGGLLFAVAAWPVPRLLAARQAPFFYTLRNNGKRLFFVLPLAASLLCFLLAFPLFFVLNSNIDPKAPDPGGAVNTGSWVLYIASLVFFGVAFVAWERTAPTNFAGVETAQPGDRLPRQIEWIVLATLLLVGLFLRLPDLSSVPPGLWFDEAQNGIVARQLTDPGAIHRTFIGDNTQMGAIYFYALGLLLKVLGSGVWVLRLLPALAGALIVPMLYLLGARLYGWRVGLAAAGFVAISTWNITLSRLGMVSMVTVAFDVAVFLCIAQALRTGRLGYFALAGVLFGLALQMYYVSRLVPVVLVAVLIHRLITERMRLVRALRTGVVVFAVGALIAFLPVGTFTMQHWDDYNGRISEVSIFGDGGGGNPDAFSISLNKHMLMFNFAGDQNGRHNLPGQPMLDWITAALFFTGLASCLFRAWRWQYFFPIAWLMAVMSGGVLSLLFEAPQAHRTLEASVVTALIAGIFLGELWQMISRAFAPSPAPVEVVEEPEPRFVERPRRRSAAPRASLPRRPIPAAPSTLPVRKRPAGATSGAMAATTLPVRGRASAPTAGEKASAPAIAAATRGSWLAMPEGTGGSTVLELSGDATVSAPAALAVPANGAAYAAAVAVQPALSRRQILAMAVSALGIAAVVAWSGSININRYFNIQANDRGVWKNMYTAETQAARVLAQYGSTREVYITPVYADLPPSKYLAPGLSPLDWRGMQTIPFAPSQGRDVVIVLDPPSAGDLSLIARIYPHARFDPLRAPSDPEPLMYTITIPRFDIVGVQGVHDAVYGSDLSKPTSEKTVPLMEASARQGTGTERLTSTLKVDRFGYYKFNWPGALMVDGYSITSANPISLTEGLHTVVATATLGSNIGAARLLWTIPDSPGAAEVPSTNLLDPTKIEPHGLTAYFRHNDTFTGPPADGRVDPVISAYYHHTPLDRPYTTDWSGRLYVPTGGSYTFGTEQLSRSRLLIDGQQVIANMAQNSLIENQMVLQAGWHDIEVQFEDLDNYSHMYLYWAPPGMQRTIIPSAFLWPKQGRYPDKPMSGPFPTLAEADGLNLPLDRVIDGISLEPGNQAAPAVSGQPPQQATEQPQSSPQAPQLKGEQLQPLFMLGQGPDALPGPWAAAGDPQGNIYVYSYKDGKVHKFDAGGKPLTSWDVKDDQGRALPEVSAMVISGTQVLLLDAASSNLLTYDLAGKPMGLLHLCDCYFPRGMSKARDGNLWVADTGIGRVIKVAPGGKIVQTLGEKGSEPGKFSEPTSVWETASGVIYVADVGNARVQSFSADLKPLAQWSMGKSIARDGNRLTGDASGNVLVTEAGSHTIALYDRNGKEIHRWAYATASDAALPQGIANLGDRVIVLFPNNDLAAVVNPTGK